MYKTLAPDCIGHNAGLEISAPVAKKYGFEGIWFNMERDARMPVKETKMLLEKYGLKAAGFGLPVEYRKGGVCFPKGHGKTGGVRRICPGMRDAQVYHLDHTGQ
ncbi:MAG: hypothetical protein ACLRMZ_17125 [Blautia marasmi]